MSTLQIDLDEKTGDALTSLAAARGTTPADLVAEIVAQYVEVKGAPAQEKHERSLRNGAELRKLTGVSIDEILELAEIDRGERGPAPPDPMDALIGSLRGEPADDIDEVVYGR